MEFYINENTLDIELNGNNDFKFVEGTDEILQRLRHKIILQGGEWFVRSDNGQSYFEWTTSKGIKKDGNIGRPEKLTIKNEIFQTIKNDKDVLEIIKFEYSSS